MERNDEDGGIVDAVLKKVKRAFGGPGSKDEDRLKNTDIAAQARGVGAGDVSDTEADVNMFGTEEDPNVSATAEDRARGSDLGTEYGVDETAGISTEPSLGEGDAGAVDAPVGRD